MKIAGRVNRGVGQVLVVLFLLFVFPSTFNSVHAQEDLNVLAFGSGRSGKAPIPQGDFQTLTIPIKRAQNLLLIEARINGMQGNFILDTGAPTLVLNKTYFRNGKLADGATAAGITGAGEQVYHIAVDSLVIEDLFYSDLDADLVNLGHIEDAKGVKILGLLGANLFAELEMQIDLQNDVLILSRLNSNGESQEAGTGSATSHPDLTMPFDLVGNILFMDGSVGEKKLRFCLDTGAETNVLSNSVGNKVLQQFSLTSRADLGGSSSRNLNVLSGQLNTLTVGNHTFKNVPVILADLSGLQEVYNTSINGILGYNFLSKGRAIINFKKRELTMYFYQEEGQ